MEFIKKAVNWFFEKCLEIFQWMEKNRIKSVLGAFLIGLFFAFGFLWFITEIPPEETKGVWQKILHILSTALKKDENYLIKYPTSILALISLPVAFVLWLFRNHDIVMNLDLQMYHEAVRNIHNQDDKKVSGGLRKVAFKTLMELKEKSAWKEKIRENVFPGANLRWLNLYEAKLQRMNLTKTNLTEANLTEADLTEATLIGANLYGAYYYKDEKARILNERTLVTKKWLRERGAKNVATVYGIDE